MANRWSNEPILCEYALKTNSIITYINYRLAPEYKHPTAVYDCYDCLKVLIILHVSIQFVLDHSEEYHFDKNQVLLLGDSAGGMICFGICELAIQEYKRNIFSKMVWIINMNISVDISLCCYG